MDGGTALWRPWLRGALLAPLPAVLGEITPPAVPRLPAARPRRQMAQLKRDLLNKLDQYQTYIRRLKRGDPEAYGIYRRIGAYILPEGIEAQMQLLEPGVVHRLPAFGAIALGIGDPDVGENNWTGDTKVKIRFAYFMKLDKPGRDIERANTGSTYRCALYFDDRTEKWMKEIGGGGFGEYAINVAPDGTVRPLRMLKILHQKVRHRADSGAPRGLAATGLGPAKTQRLHNSSSWVAHQAWRLPDFRNNEVTGELADHLRWLFCMTANFWAGAAAASMVRVVASKAGIVMPFVVPELDLAAFFRDREKIGNKRIFHLVRAHTRVGTKGVQLHFRGLKHFRWNNFDIDITVPGKFSHDITDATFGALELADDEETAAGQLSLAEMTEFLAERIGSPADQLEPA